MTNKERDEKRRRDEVIKTHAGPNRQKFASQVAQLNPLDVTYTQDVLLLHKDYDARENAIDQLFLLVNGIENRQTALTGTQMCDLLSALRFAIERFITDSLK